MRDTTMQAERLTCIRLRTAINTHLEDRSLTTPAAIGVPRSACRLPRGCGGTAPRALSSMGRCRPWSALAPMVPRRRHMAGSVIVCQ
jgi:hypothetical protein